MEDLLRLVSQAVKQNIDWSGIEAALSSFVIPMSRTEQNPAFHAEGDVWTHTKMVCENIGKLNAVRHNDEPFVTVVQPFVTAFAIISQESQLVSRR